MASMVTLASWVLPVSAGGRGGGPSRRSWRGAWCSGRPWSCRYHEPGTPLRAGGAVDLAATAVDEQPRRNAVDPGQIGEDALPHAALGSAPEAVVKRLLGALDMFGAIAPAPAALQCMDNPGQHAPVIDPACPAYLSAKAARSAPTAHLKTRRNPPPVPPPRWKRVNHNPADLGILSMGPDPSFPRR